MKAILIHGTPIGNPAIKGGATCRFGVCIGDITPSGNVTLTISSRYGYVTTNGPLTFTTSNFLTPQEVTVTAVVDGEEEGIKYDYLSLTLSGGGYSTRKVIKIPVADAFIEPQFLRGYPGYYLNISNPAAMRAALIAEVFNGFGLPSNATPDSGTANYTGTMHQTSTGALTGANVTKLVFVREDRSGYEWAHIVYWIKTTAQKTKKICIVHGGHGSETGHVDMIQDLLNAGCDVLYCAMPITLENTENNPTVNATGVSGHNDIKTGGLDNGTYNPLELYFFAQIEGLNYIQAQTSQYRNIYACGCSGGGWSAMWLAALDTRISKAFDIRGVTPYQYVNLSANADYEQGPVVGLTSLTIGEGATSTQVMDMYRANNYYDLMILASAGGREFHMLHHYDDSCCHNTYLYNLFFNRLKEDGKVHGCTFDLRIWTNPLFSTHSFNTPDRAYIIERI